MNKQTADNNQTAANIINKPAPSSPKLELGDFGNSGRYSALQSEAFRDAQKVFRLPIEKADKLARLIGSDFGAYMSQREIGLSSVKVGKASKDGKVTLKEAGGSVKGATLTWPLFCLKTLVWANEAGDHGISVAETAWKVNNVKLGEWFDKKLC